MTLIIVKRAKTLTLVKKSVLLTNLDQKVNADLGQKSSTDPGHNINTDLGQKLGINLGQKINTDGSGKVWLLLLFGYDSLGTMTYMVPVVIPWCLVVSMDIALARCYSEKL